jgi:Arc/MetJ-type ribon-helix-helix transcriptional regulator
MSIYLIYTKDQNIIYQIYKSGQTMKKMLVSVTEGQLEELDKLVASGVYGSKADAVRDAVCMLLEKDKLSKLEEKLEPVE